MGEAVNPLVKDADFDGECSDPNEPFLMGAASSSRNDEPLAVLSCPLDEEVEEERGLDEDEDEIVDIVW